LASKKPYDDLKNEGCQYIKENKIKNPEYKLNIPEDVRMENPFLRKLVEQCLSFKAEERPSAEKLMVEVEEELRCLEIP